MNEKISMTIAELKNKILAKGWHFKFVSPNPFKKKDFDWKNLEQVDKEHGGFEAYLKKIAESQRLKELNIDTRAKNGSGFMNKGIFCVQIENIENIGNIEPVKTPDPIISTNSTPKIEPIENKEVKTNTISMNPTEDLKTHIENASMKTELRFLQQENERLKESNKKLDQKNESLFTEVSKLTRELATDKTKNDLEFQKKELELMSQNKAGLSGIVEEVKNMDPKTLGMIISVFQPNNKAVQAMMNSGENSDTGGSLNGPRHDDVETQSYIENSIYPLLTSADTPTVGMIGSLIEYFIKFPDHLVMSYNKFFPGVVPPDTKTKGTGSTDDLDENENENN